MTLRFPEVSPSADREPRGCQSFVIMGRLLTLGTSILFLQEPTEDERQALKSYFYLFS